MSKMQEIGDVTTTRKNKSTTRKFDYESIAKYGDGRTLQETADHFGCSTFTVSKAFRMFGGSSKGTHSAIDEKKEKMQELRDLGWPIDNIASHLGVCCGTVQKYTKASKNAICITTLTRMLADGVIPEKETKVTHYGLVVGTFTPAKSAH